ncbi:MAG: hypothetical protein IJR82_03550 [Bacilli bacterium]|nr:hypothetical protein [Bacilli bacterium]
MAEINVEELNWIIKNTDFYGLMYTYPMTPQINSFTIKHHSIFCSIDARNEIRDRFIRNKFPDNQKIPEKLHTYVIEFLLADNIPEEEKNIVSEHLDEDLKKLVFINYLNEIAKISFKIDPQDISMELYYNPKLNGVPLKKYYIQNNLLTQESIEISFNRIKEIIENTTKPNIYELICIKHLFNENSLLNKKWCPQNIKNLMAKLNTTEWDRYENDIYLNNDKLIKNDLKQKHNIHEVHMNEDLKKELIVSVPDTFDALEKSIYNYYKLCQLLSYDSIYYINNKSKENEPVSNIGNYNSSNNNVICYEFSYIYSDSLQEIGITNIEECPLNDGKFQNRHANIKYLVDDLVIFADSTTSVLDGDLSTAKYTSELKGIRCELYDESSQKRFKRAKEKVRLYIEKENALIDSMLLTKEQYFDLSINDKIILFNNYLMNCNLTNCDFISYAKKLISILGLNIETNLYYDTNMANRFFLQVNLPTSYVENEQTNISYTIDTINKKIYDKPTDEWEFEEKITNKHI